MRPRSSNEERGLRHLANAAKPLRPFDSKETQYFILGDGVDMRMAKKLRILAVQPRVPAITIDPAYTPRYISGTKGSGRLRSFPKNYYRQTRRARNTKPPKKKSPNWPPLNTKRLTFVGKKAESYRLTGRDLADSAFIVVLSHCAHTSTAAFVSKILKVKPRTAQIFAASFPCHSPGLKGLVLRKDGWQILCPKGTRGYARATSSREEDEKRRRAISQTLNRAVAMMRERTARATHKPQIQTRN